MVYIPVRRTLWRIQRLTLCHIPFKKRLQRLCLFPRGLKIWLTRAFLRSGVNCENQTLNKVEGRTEEISNEENGRWSQFLLISECISVSRVIRCLKAGIYLSNKGLNFLLPTNFPFLWWWRVRADLIIAFKIFTGLLNVDPNLFFLPPTRRDLRVYPR